MKKLIVLLICSVFLGSIFAQVQKKNAIPAAAKSAFVAKFPKAQKVKWSTEKADEYEAEFELNKVESSALFNAKGTFLELENEIKLKDLPKSVQTAILKDFGTYKLGETSKVTDANGKVTYEVEVQKNKQKFEVTFDQNGKQLNKEEIKKEND